MDDAQLRTVWQQRQYDSRISSISEPLAMFMKNTLAKRVKQLSQLSTIWDEIIPHQIQEHTALESLNNGGADGSCGFRFSPVSSADPTDRRLDERNPTAFCRRFEQDQADPGAVLFGGSGNRAKAIRILVLHRHLLNEGGQYVVEIFTSTAPNTKFEYRNSKQIRNRNFKIETIIRNKLICLF